MKHRSDIAPQGRRGFFAAFLDALHESRRRQAAREIEKYRYLIDEAKAEGARHPPRAPQRAPPPRARAAPDIGAKGRGHANRACFRPQKTAVPRLKIKFDAPIVIISFSPA